MSSSVSVLSSLAIHAAVVGTAVALWLAHDSEPEKDDEEIAVYFELVEESAPPVEPAPEPEVVAPQAPAQTPDSLDIPDIPVLPDIPALAPIPPPPATPPPPAQTPAPPAASPSLEERAKVVSYPVALNRITPVYPRSARRKGHEGRVAALVSVAVDGTVSDAEVVASSGFAELDDAALVAVRAARFAPATEDGAAVDGRLRMTIDFRLK